jgi:enoyl-CoA hydratase/carnithine racemase
MDGLKLEPWMLKSDWRGDRRPLLIVDLADWPEALQLAPLPPVPVIAVGPAGHPQASRADVLDGEVAALSLLASKIEQTPQASAVLVQLLRSIEGMSPERALPLESLAFAALQAGTEHAAWLAGSVPALFFPSGALRVRRENDTLHLLIDRPDALNAIDREMRDALFEAFCLVALDPGIARVKLRGRGRCFSMGADLAEFGTTRDPVQAHAIRLVTLPAYPMARRAGIYDVHVHGGCVGSGLEMAAFAGRLTAAPNTWFQLPETGMGILPGAGGCVSVARRMGRQRAAALMLSGKRIGAEAALRLELIDAIMDEPAIDEGGADGCGG